MSEKKRIVIAEDHTMIREALNNLLSSSPDYTVVGEAGNGLDAIRCVSELSPDLILLDLLMPKMNGTEAILDIKKQRPKTKVLILTMHDTEDDVLLALQAGADGYVLKDDSYEELLIALKSVFAGNRYLSPGVSGKVIEGWLRKEKESTSRNRPSSVGVSDKER